MNFSSLKYSTFSGSWTNLPIYKLNETLVAGSDSINNLWIYNNSGTDRVYSVNAGPPFPVPTGTGRTYDLRAAGCVKAGLTVEFATATLNSHYVDGV